ncbi:hypothetical protein ACF0H5_020827 [Mactra antiquata]
MKYIYSRSPSRSPERSSRNDPFGAYLKKGHVQFIVDDDITTAKRRYTPEKRRRRSPEKTRRPRVSIYYCDLCPFKTSYRQDLRKHIKRHEDPSHPCRDCNMPFMTKGHLHGHLREMHGKGPSINKRRLKCEMCTYTTYQAADLRRHNSRHKAVGVHHCRYCNHPFMSFNHMVIHAKKEHKASSYNHRHIAKGRSKRSSEDNSLQRGVRKAKETLSSRERHTNNYADCVDKNKDKHDNVETTTEKMTHSDDENETTDQNTEHETTHKKSVNYLDCAFCQYVAVSYADLKEHLDVHDDDHKSLGIECSDSASVSTDNSHNEVDELDNINVTDKSNMEIDTDNGNDVNNVDVVLPETNIDDSGDMYMVNSNTNLSAVSTETLHSLQTVEENENEFGNINEDDSDFKDAMNIYGDCLTKLTKKSKDDFIMKPFACARCFFTTGNIDHLKVHVEAHLYEKAREAYEVARRGGVTWTDDEIDSRNCNNVTDTCDDKILSKEHEYKSDDVEDSNVSEVGNIVTNIVNDSADLNVEADNIEDADEGFIGEDSVNKTKEVCKENDEKLVPTTDYLGRLSKCEFQKTKRLYKNLNHHTLGVVYECSVCENDYVFNDINSIREHFKMKHSDLRNKICQSCKHCSKPFP